VIKEGKEVQLLTVSLVYGFVDFEASVQLRAFSAFLHVTYLLQNTFKTYSDSILSTETMPFTLIDR